MTQDIKIRIINKASELFITYGYSKVSMDDITTGLGISKKTLYAHFESKEALLNQIVETYMNGILTENEKILKETDLEYPDKVAKLFNHVATKLSAINPFFLEDVYKNAPTVWQTIQNYKTEAAYTRFSKLLDEGVKKGYVRRDINRTLVIVMYAGAIDNIFNPNFTRQIPKHMMKDLPYSASAIFDELIQIIFNGILIK